jgi:multicomponent Na+:H+ antiporter subunit C
MISAVTYLLQARFEYAMIAILVMVGMYGVIAKRNLVKKLISLNILQTAVVLFFVSFGLKRGGTVPILPHAAHAHVPEIYMSPLPHVLMLTAIVVMVSTSGVAFALVIRIYRRYGTLDESTLLGPPP